MVILVHYYTSKYSTGHFYRHLANESRWASSWRSIQHGQDWRSSLFNHQRMVTRLGYDGSMGAFGATRAQLESRSTEITAPPPTVWCGFIHPYSVCQSGSRSWSGITGSEPHLTYSIYSNAISTVPCTVTHCIVSTNDQYWYIYI